MSSYVPRPDQIEAVMRRSRCSYQQAREICVKNFEEWRDRPRDWQSIQTDYGTYFVVERRKR